MLTEVFAEVYEKFKLNLYKHMFVNGGGKEHELTATETFTLEVIHAMKNPKVSQLAEFLEMSTPNVAYKISSLMKKGYIAVSYTHLLIQIMLLTRKLSFWKACM